MQFFEDSSGFWAIFLFLRNNFVIGYIRSIIWEMLWMRIPIFFLGRKGQIVLNNRSGGVSMKRNLVLVVMSVLLVIGSVTVFAEEQPLVNLFLFETGIRDALSEISLQTDINIIPDSTVNGVVTADLQDVPLEQALRIILVGGGFVYRKIDDFYLVGLPDPRSNTFKELVDTQVYHLTNVTAGQLMNVMPAFLGSYVKGDRDSRLIIITAPPTEMERILEFVRAVDTPQKQVEIQVIVTEVSSEGLKDLGTSLFEFAFGSGEKFNEDWTASIGYAKNLLSLDTTIFGRLITNLKLLEEKQEAKIHADPRVLVSDGSSAELFIGDRQILLVSGSSESATRVERIEVGMHLKVLPQIVGDDEIVLTIEPEMSHFIRDSKPDLMVKQSSVSTTIRLKSGQTAVLAGMTVQESGDYSRKVPVLGDIPIIRWLFRNDVVRESAKELLIFVTPVIQ